MAFWNDPSALYPKQSHRWVVSFGDSGNYIEPHYIKSIDRPSYEVGSVQAKMLYSHVHNFPKRVVWKPIKIEFYDVVDTSKKIPELYVPHNERNYSSEYIIHQIFTASGYEPDSYIGYTFKNNLIANLINPKNNTYNNESNFMRIKQFDAEGKMVDKWKLYKPFITSVESGKLEYSSDNILTITANISYDYAEIERVISSEALESVIQLSNLETNIPKINLNDAFRNKQGIGSLTPPLINKPTPSELNINKTDQQGIKEADPQQIQERIRRVVPLYIEKA